MGFLDSVGNLFSSGTGGNSTFGNILGSLAVGSQIFSNYNQSKNADKVAEANTAFTQQKFDEDKRQFDLNYQLALQKLAQGGGGGGGGGGGAAIAAQMAAKRAELIQAAYKQLADNALQGRTAEAGQLNNLLTGINQVLLQRPNGALVR